jgi:hypothetical protein
VLPRMSAAMNPVFEVSFFENDARVPAAPGPATAIGFDVNTRHEFRVRTSTVELCELDVRRVRRGSGPNRPPGRVDVRAECAGCVDDPAHT